MMNKDGIPMSQAKTEPTVGIHFTWKKDSQGILEALPHLEKVLMKHEMRPHFGKVFTLSGDYFEKMYG